MFPLSKPMVAIRTFDQSRKRNCDLGDNDLKAAAQFLESLLLRAGSCLLFSKIENGGFSPF